MRTWLLFLCARVTMTGARKLPFPTSGPTLKKVAEFDLPGPPGKRFDYLRAGEVLGMLPTLED